MCTAAERAGFVDDAACGARVEKGTGPIGTFREGFSARRAHGLRGGERFPFGEAGGFSGEAELAAFGAERACAAERPTGDPAVNRPHFRKRGGHIL